jgi:TolB protein
MRIVICLLISLVISADLWAQTKLSVQGAGRLYPIATPQLCVSRGESEAAKEIPRIIARNLDLSGFFDVLNPNSYIETPGSCTGPDDFAYSDWSVIGVEGLVRGVVTSSRRKIKVQLFLHDVQIRRVVLGKEYEGNHSQIRNIAHKFSNEIVKFFTGEPGIFGSQISFSSKVGRFKELFVMDMDGSNLRQLTGDRGLAISSSWSPLGGFLIYTTYKKRVPDLFLFDLHSKKVKQITKGSALELGGKFSRDGRRILASRSMGKDSDIVLLHTDGSLAKSLTRSNGAIDVSPDWSPDNSQIVFCSNRGGGPQIYTMSADGRNAKRVSYVSSSYCTSPVWSPKGDRIAFVCRASGGHQLFTAAPDGSDPLQITNYGKNEDPAWSPDGRYLVFASTAFASGRIFNLGLIRSDGSNLRRLTSGRSGDTSPAWSSVVP